MPDFVNRPSEVQIALVILDANVFRCHVRISIDSQFH